MSRFLRRRQFLTTVTASALLPAAGHAQTTPNNAAAPRELVIDRRTISVNERPAQVYRLGPPDGGSGLVLDPGERFRVRVRNRLDEPTIIHWHGQTPPAGQDGVADMGAGAKAETLIPPHGERTYDFAARPGTHFMHSHHGLQEQSLLAAPLIVREPDAAADVRDVVMLLQDFTWRDPADILAALGGPTGHGGHAGHAMPAMRMGGMADLNDVLYDAFLANDRTLASPQVVRLERGTQVRLRVINAASATQFWLDPGALEDTLLAVDGDPVMPFTAPTMIPLAIGQRIDLGFRMPSAGVFPVYAQVEGTAKRTAIVLATPDAIVPGNLETLAPQAAPPLDMSLDRKLNAGHPLAARAPDVRHAVTLGGGMMGYEWTINGATWERRTPLQVRLGQRVALDFVNQSPMAHPMHLHGHHFQVIAVNGLAISGPMRDTVLVPAHGGRVSVVFYADNPGSWLLHCHNLYHMAAGMMTEIAYTGLS